MNILFLNHNIAWSGGFFRSYHWGRHLAKMGHSVTLMTISERGRMWFTQTIKDNVCIIKSPDLFVGKLRTGWDPYDVVRRIGYLIGEEFEIVHCVDTRPNVVFPGLFMKYKCGSKLIMDWGDWWGRGGTISERSNSTLEKLFEPVETFFEERFRHYADGHVVLTDALLSRCLDLGVTRPIVKIPHGADTVRVKPKDKIHTRQKMCFPMDSKIVGYLGTIFPQDAKFLISSFEIANNLIPGLKLLIIGNCNASFPSKLIANKSIILTGKVSFEKMIDYISVCDFMLLPLKDTIANRGRWPSKVCDYLAAGRPVIGTSVGDISKLLNNSKAGLITSDNPASYAEAICNAFSLGDLTEREFVARSIAEKELSWHKLTGELEIFYKKI